MILNRLIYCIIFFLNAHSRLIENLRGHLTSTSAYIEYYPSGVIYIGRLKEYFPNGTFAYIYDLRPAEKILWDEIGHDFCQDFCEIRQVFQILFRRAQRIENLIREIDPDYRSRLTELALIVPWSLWY